MEYASGWEAITVKQMQEVLSFIDSNHLQKKVKPVHDSVYLVLYKYTLY